MKLCVVGHSMVHIRQQNFFGEVAKLGHDVLVLAPGEWREQRAKDYSVPAGDEGTFTLKTLRHFGGEDVYRFQFVGMKDAIEEFDPDVLYIQQEPSSLVAAEAAEIPINKAVFVWENIAENFTPYANEVLTKYDLVVCGNDDAEKAVKKHNENTIILPQVGVDTVHFQARPGVDRSISVGYIGRPSEEKGVGKLMLAWPTARVLPWQPYEQLPWWYSMCKIIVCYSQDVPHWREQAMPYVAMEGICCGVIAVVSDAGSIPFWHTEFAEGCPGSFIVEQDDLSGLRTIIRELLKGAESQTASKRAKLAARDRAWVVKNLSSQVIARRLVDALVM